MKHKKQLRKVNDDTVVIAGSEKPADNTAKKSLTIGQSRITYLYNTSTYITRAIRVEPTNEIIVYTSDYPVDFSSKGSVCGVLDTGIQESKDSARQSRSLNNDDERSQRYDLSEVSEADDDDDVDGADDEIIDIVGDHSHNMLNNVQRSYEQQRFF